MISKIEYSDSSSFFFFFQAEDGIRDLTVTGVQTCALPIFGVPDRRIERADGIHSAYCFQCGDRERRYASKKLVSALPRRPNADACARLRLRFHNAVSAGPRLGPAARPNKGCIPPGR